MEKTAAVKEKQGVIAIFVIAVSLVIDQIIKILVKTNMYLGEQIHITDWFYISFVENNGMAFGMELFGKLFLSLFRIAAIALFVWYLCRIINKGFPKGYIICVSFIIAGAIGNLFDCVLYGRLFTESGYGPDGIAAFAADCNGYAPILFGKVVDMFYFPLWTWPESFPLVGGKVFFGPVFNFADSCISCGMVVLILFYAKYLNSGFNKPQC